MLPTLRRLALATYYLAYDARRRTRQSGPPADPGPAYGPGLVARRPGGTLLPQPLDPEPDRDGPPPDRPRPVGPDRAGPGDHARPAGGIGRRRGCGDPAAARCDPRGHDVDVERGTRAARRDRGQDADHQAGTPARQRRTQGPPGSGLVHRPVRNRGVVVGRTDHPGQGRSGGGVFDHDSARTSGHTTVQRKSCASWTAMGSATIWSQREHPPDASGTRHV